MNTYITLACLLAVVATGHGSAIGGWGGVDGWGGGWGHGWGGAGWGGAGWGGAGWGGPGWGGAGWGGWGGKGVVVAPAISTQNLIKAAPIPVIKSVAVAPVITAPILKTLPASTVGWGNGLGWGVNGGLGWGGLGWGGAGYGGGWGKGGWGGWGGKW